MTGISLSGLLRRWGFALAVIVAAAPAYAQSLGLSRSPDISWWRIIGAFALCCLLAGAGAFALRLRLRGQTAGRPNLDAAKWRRLIASFGSKGVSDADAKARLTLIETLHLPYQVAVCLFECDGVGVLIATSPQGAFIVNRDPPTKVEASS